MSPEIKVKGTLLASVPDETGWYDLPSGGRIYVNVAGIAAYNKVQRIILEAEEVGGRRMIGLTQEGKGSSSDRKRGDHLDPEVEVTLLDRPIRVSYSGNIRREWHNSRSLGTPRGGYWKEEVYKRTYYNPRWMKHHGGR